jgi:hypothetical protein
VIQALNRQEAATGEGEADGGFSTLATATAPVAGPSAGYLAPMSLAASPQQSSLTPQTSTDEELAIWPARDDDQAAGPSPFALPDEELPGLDQILTDDLAEDILAAWS